MPTPIRLTIQAIIAGVVAALMLLGVRGLAADAQWGPTEPPPSEEPTAEPTSEPAAEAYSPSIDPCQMVTQAEAETALAASATVVSDSAQCTYVSGDLSGRALSVALTPLPSEEGALEAAMTQMADSLNGELREINVGDEAFVVLADLLAQGMTRVGDQAVVVVMTAPAGTTDQQAATLTQLSQTAADRL